MNEDPGAIRGTRPRPAPGSSFVSSYLVRIRATLPFFDGVMSTAAGGARSECTVCIGCMPAPGRVACKSRDTADAAFQHSAVPVLYTCRVKALHIQIPRTHMASATSRLEDTLRRWVPAPVRRKLRGETGRRFARFVLVAVAAVLSSQL